MTQINKTGGFLIVYPIYDYAHVCDISFWTSKHLLNAFNTVPTTSNNYIEDYESRLVLRGACQVPSAWSPDFSDRFFGDFAGFNFDVCDTFCV
jgi:hypothetical protein